MNPKWKPITRTAQKTQEDPGRVSTRRLYAIPRVPTLTPIVLLMRGSPRHAHLALELPRRLEEPPWEKGADLAILGGLL